MQDRYFDIGVNLTHESFDNDYKNVIENAFENSVDRIPTIKNLIVKVLSTVVK